MFTQLMGAIVARPPAIQLGPASSSEGPTNKKGRKATVLPLFHKKGLPFYVQCNPFIIKRPQNKGR